MFHGIIPPLCTPLTEDGEVDTASLERLCGFLLDAGVHGLFVCGSTGEVSQLTDRARAAALRTVVGTAAGRVPVLAGVVDTATPRVVEHARTARELGADAVVATAPFYVGTALPEVRDHYRRLAAAVDVPVVAYDIPSNVGRKLPAELLGELARDGVIAAVKDSSGDLESFQRLLDATDGTGTACLTGSEKLADLALLRGAHGVVPGLGNIDPHGYLRLHRAAGDGDWDTARREQWRLTRLFAAVTAAADPARIGPVSAALGAFKTALVLRGVIDRADTLPPLLPLTGEETERIATCLADAGLLPEPASRT
ncbi:dihydrodipicolinate synthase family protein [Streptomyces sp. URMC 125]|uniref:dihydrodipicolinate synthase family protein n=1 Tax=Streptomyces sp. URMC 125 TaxID=3423419 RepID=UPI003F1D3452